MNSSYCMPNEKMATFWQEGRMNSIEGILLFGIADPSVKQFLPPPLELVDPVKPVIYLHIGCIREPSFAPWYMEGGIGVMAKYGEKTGLYYFSLQLSGPGALMGTFTGREGAGLPKKLCEKIVVERTDEHGHCRIERNGVRLVDVELEMGRYNEPAFRFEAEQCQGAPRGFLSEGGGCLLHKYRMDGAEVRDMELIFYDSPTRYYRFEPAAATVKLNSSIDDPWGEIPLRSVLGAGWFVNDNWVAGTSVLYRYPQEAATETMRYLFAGRYDRSLLCREHQRYETE